MRLRQLCLLLTATILLAACTGGNKAFTVEGNIKGMPVQQVRLLALNIFQPIQAIDSATSDEQGRFKLKGTSLEPGIYQIEFGNDKERRLLLSMDRESAVVTADWGALNESYNVAGSPASSSLRTLMTVVREHARDLRTFGLIYDTMRARGDSGNVARVEADMAGLNKNLTGYIKAYADSSKYLPNVLLALGILNDAAEESYINNIVGGLEKRFPGSETAKTFAGKYAETMRNQAPPPPPTNGGNPAKEISQPGPDGKIVALSSLRGKYVLIDFWASWCGPCRGENPNVVAAFNKYKDRGFTIYGVSLDSKKEFWLEAIKKDGLTWTQVSDLQHWQNAAAQDYGVNSIPTNFLVDPQGNIIAQDLRGDELDARLDNVLPK